MWTGDHSEPSKLTINKIVTSNIITASCPALSWPRIVIRKDDCSGGYQFPPAQARLWTTSVVVPMHFQPHRDPYLILSPGIFYKLRIYQVLDREKEVEVGRDQISNNILKQPPPPPPVRREG